MSMAPFDSSPHLRRAAAFAVTGRSKLFSLKSHRLLSANSRQRLVVIKSLVNEKLAEDFNLSAPLGVFVSN